MTFAAGKFSGVSSPSDPYWSSVGLLLHLDSSFADSSNNNIQVTGAGDAQITTTDPKFGAGCLLLDGTGDYLTVASNTNNSYGTGDFTVEFWAYFTSASTYQQIISSATTGNMIIGINGVAGKVGIGRHNTAWDSNGTHNISNTTWAHIAICRSGSSLYIFVDGTQVAGSPFTNSNSYNSGAMYVGGQSTYCVNGKIDDLRMTKGVCRYTSNFNRPWSPFPNK